MALLIGFVSEAFPPSTPVARSGQLSVTWDELLWAALTVGRPNLIHVFQHGASSYHEALFRLSLVRMALQQRGSSGRRLVRTSAFKELDPTEKGAINYFLGLAICKLFAARLLNVPWTLHLDVFKPVLNPSIFSGRSRPDMVGQATDGTWHAFECKGRMSAPGASEKTKAKQQALRLLSVNGTPCALHIGAITYFQNESIQFYWRDPEPSGDEIKLPEPKGMWEAYYKPIHALYRETRELDTTSYEALDIEVSIHPDILAYLDNGDWEAARNVALAHEQEFRSAGFESDGLRVVARDSWRERRVSPIEF